MDTYITFIKYIRSSKILTIEINGEIIIHKLNNNKNINDAELENVLFKKNYNKSVQNLPIFFKKLKFNNEFNKSIDKLAYVTNISLGKHFNQTVDELSNSLIYLKFGHIFNKNVDNLPSSIITLIFGNNFNHPVKNLPNSIKMLIFGYNFNQSINNYLPNSLLKLELGNRFKKSINYLPNSMMSLNLKPHKFKNLYFSGTIILKVCEDLKLCFSKNIMLHELYNFIFDDNINYKNIKLVYIDNCDIFINVQYLKNNVNEIILGSKFYCYYGSQLQVLALKSLNIQIQEIHKIIDKYKSV